MPKKKRKPASEMEPREMLEQVFPKRVVRRLEKEVSESDSADSDHDTGDE